jgi:hypothetical protein
MHELKMLDVSPTMQLKRRGVPYREVKWTQYPVSRALKRINGPYRKEKEI